MNGKLIDPRPPQWERRQAIEDVVEDGIICLAATLKSVLTDADGVNSTVVQLAALHLVQRAVIGNYQEAMGIEAAREARDQASKLADHYICVGADGLEWTE